MGERVRVRAVLRRGLPSSAPPAGGGTFSPIGEKGSTFYINYMWNPFRPSLVKKHAKEITGDVWLNITSLSNAARKAATDRTPLRFDGELSGIVTLIQFWILMLLKGFILLLIVLKIFHIFINGGKCMNVQNLSL